MHARDFSDTGHKTYAKWEIGMGANSESRESNWQRRVNWDRLPEYRIERARRR